MVALGQTEVPAKYLPTVLAASAKYGVPPAFLAAQIDAESSFNPDAVSPAGAIGISQFMPGTAASLGINPHDPTQSINAMAKLMAHYKKEFGTWEKALYAYHDGPGKADNPGPAGKAYAKKILGKVGSAIADAGGKVTGAVTSFADPFKKTEALLARFSDSDVWRRVGLWAMGSTLVVFAVLIIVWNYAGNDIKKVL